MFCGLLLFIRGVASSPPAEVSKIVLPSSQSTSSSGWLQPNHDPLGTRYAPEVLGPTQLRVRWTYTAQPFVPGYPIWYTHPVVTVDGVVILADLDATLVALQGSSGEVLWRFAPNDTSRCPTQPFPISWNPALHPTLPLSFFEHCAVVYAVDVRCGAFVWSTHTCLYNSAISDGLVVIQDGSVLVLCNDTVNRYNSATGTLIVSLPWNTSPDVLVTASPVLSPSGDTVYIGSTKGLLAMDIGTSKPRWSIPSGIQAEAIVADPDGTRVYWTNGNVICSDAVTGKLIWQQEFPLGGAIGLAVGGDNMLFVTGDMALMALDSRKGALLWSNNYSSLTYWEGATVDRANNVFVGGDLWVGNNSTGAVMSLDRKGNPLWQFNVNANDCLPPTLAPDGTLLVVCNDLNLYALFHGSSNG